MMYIGYMRCGLGPTGRTLVASQKTDHTTIFTDSEFRRYRAAGEHPSFQQALCQHVLFLFVFSCCLYFRCFRLQSGPVDDQVGRATHHLLQMGCFRDAVFV